MPATSSMLPDEVVEWNRSPIRTGTGCRPYESRRVQRGEGSGGDAEGGQEPESPSQRRQTRFQARAKEMPSGGSRRGPHSSAGKRGSRRHESAYQNMTDRPIIVDRPYCSHACLYGLAHGVVTDTYCPNFRFHKTKHPAKSYFLRLVRQQLQLDTGKDADCVPLHIHGARGGLLKICLTSHGYTFGAKGTEQHNHERLRHEHGIYRQLLPLQGNHVPVCLGLMKLRQVYYYSGGATVSSAPHELGRPTTTGASQQGIHSKIPEIGGRGASSSSSAQGLAQGRRAEEHALRSGPHKIDGNRF